MSHAVPQKPELGTIQPKIMTARLPGTLWIELTSKCPLDCVFCSRKLLRGNGQHMEFALFQSLVTQLESPEVIRLNYSGESIHYPRLVEAIQLAHGAGACTELVSAFVSVPQEDIGPLVRSGLDRLTVSLHTLDPSEFPRIYGCGSVAQMREKIAALRRCQRETGIKTPTLDFAFVAMWSNLDQLGAIAEFAQEVGVTEIAVHPVIRRDEIPARFEKELDHGEFRPAFRQEFNQTVKAVRDGNPGLGIRLSTPELEGNPSLGPRPQYFCGALPAHARIFSCDQNPWDTTHILANGDVVVCEVQDKTVMGNLRESSLAEIWHGDRYREFRERYQTGRAAPCSTCAYKVAYVPAAFGARIAPGHDNDSQLFRGWYPSEETVAWSKQRSSAVLEAAAGGGGLLRIRGVLPAAPDANNELAIQVDGKQVGSVPNTTASAHPFEVTFPLSGAASQLRVDFSVRHVFQPSLIGESDVRQLGFALAEMSAEPRFGNLRFMPLLAAMRCGRALGRLPSVPGRRARRRDWNPGLSIVIPERATPDLLADSLRAALSAAQKLGEPVEIIVVVNGAPLESYARLRTEFPTVRWLHSAEALGFLKAIRKGLRAACFDWAYLLNSDMVLDPAALAEVAGWRGPDVFAIASQIFFTDARRRREETGWTGASADGQRLTVFDVTPEDADLVRTHLYAGGGSSLFRRDLLLQFSDSSDPYGPFYWEDVEWGFRALASGYQVLFCPRSWAHHTHRATVSRLYTPAEIERVFTRNSWLFAFRNGFWSQPPSDLPAELTRMDPTTQMELSSLATAASIARHVFRLPTRPYRHLDLKTAGDGFFLKPFSRSMKRPRLLMVTPYAIYPAAHGGARRIVALLEELGKAFDIVVLTDEGSAYRRDKLKDLPGVTAIHLVGGRPDDGGTEDRIRRIQTHSHAALQAEVRRLVWHYGVDLVQVEYAELAGLAESRRDGLPWFITLHDAMFSKDANSKEDLFEAALLSRFSGIVACTEEDAALVPCPGVTVIPNGFKAPARPYRSSEGNRSILFAGPFRYRPNLEGIVKFLTDVYPRLLKTVPSLGIDILGGDEGVAMAPTIGCFEQPGVRVHAFTEDVEPFWERCALSINPLTNTRGSSLKLIESIAHGRVCVSTRHGASGFAACNLPGLAQVDRVEDFESVIQRLLTDVAVRLRRETPPPDLAARFGWERSAALQAELYRRHLK